MYACEDFKYSYKEITKESIGDFCSETSKSNRKRKPATVNLPSTFSHASTVTMSGLVRYLATQKVRLLQGLSVLVFYWILVFGTLFVFGTLIVYVVINRLFIIWPLCVLYLTWVYFIDLKTFNRGGRRAEFIRNNPLFDYMRDYFPISLVKTTELDPARNYIFCYHPHGAIPDGLAIGFGSEALQFSKKFPGVVPYIGVHSCMYPY